MQTLVLEHPDFNVARYDPDMSNWASEQNNGGLTFNVLNIQSSLLPAANIIAESASQSYSNLIVLAILFMSSCIFTFM